VIKRDAGREGMEDVEELTMVLEEVISAYNDAPHQGLEGLSPNEYEKCVASG